MATATATATTTTAPHHHNPQPSWTGSLMSLLNPFASPTDDVHDATTPKSNDYPTSKQTSHSSLLKRPILSAVLSTKPNDQGPPSPSRSSGSIMFAEPDTRSTSDTGSREGSIDGRRRSKRSIRPKTQFSICHPPPEGTMRQKLHRRPRSLLQLHRLSASARPRPALEVIPSANFSVRLNRAVTRVFKTKHGLCPHDLVVLKAEKYSSEEADEEQEARDVIGLICKGRKDDDKDNPTAGGKATIHLASGMAWEASQTANGGYEFCTTDEHGLVLTVRWWPKRAKEGSKQSKRFNFSTISPNSRKHPVVGTLSNYGLDIYDAYTIPEPASKTPLSSPRNASFAVDAEEDEEESNGKEQCQTDEQLREIITITSIWVTFKEGWSPNFKYDDKDSSPSCAASPSKSVTTPLNSPPGSPAQFPLEKRNSIKSISSGIVRRTSILKSNRNSSQSVPERESTQPPSRSSSFRKTGRARADSSSTVLVHRAASNRRKNNSQATWRPDLLHTQDTVPEASREDLSSKASSPVAPSPRPSPLHDATATDGEHSLGDPRSRTTVNGTPDKTERDRGSTSTAKTDFSSGSERAARRASVAAQGQQQGTKMVSRESGKKTKRSAWRKLLCR